MMQNVLFRTNEPTAAAGKVEFYNISLFFQDVDGQRLNVVQETHGWWNNETAKAYVDEAYVPLTETYTSFEQAVDRYCARRILRARTGFMHSFTWHPLTGLPIQCTRIEVSERALLGPFSNSL
jgi:hypothetical protein